LSFKVNYYIFNQLLNGQLSGELTQIEIQANEAKDFKLFERSEFLKSAQCGVEFQLHFKPS
jgi:hypothetical protein